MDLKISKWELDKLSYEVLGAAIYVHKEVGRGMLESVYHSCMKEELKHRGINFESELKVPLVFRGKTIDIKLRCDLFIENCLVVELKSVLEMNPLFKAQLLTYMRFLNAPKGILINFNCYNLFKEGQETYVNELFRKLK